MPPSLTKPIVHTPQGDMEKIPVRIRRHGQIPIGFEVDPENELYVVSVPKEIIALKYLFKMCKNPNYSYTQLVDWYFAATGKKIHFTELSRWRNGKRTPLAIEMASFKTENER